MIRYRTRTLAVVFAVLLFPNGAWTLAAQEVAQATGEPRQTEVSLLERPSRIAVEDVTLEEALIALTKASDVALAFSPTRLPREVRVTCRCMELSVREVLDRILEDTGLLYMELAGQVVLYPAPQQEPIRGTMDRDRRGTFARFVRDAFSPGEGGPEAATVAPQEGTIIGEVTEAGSGEPIVNVQLTVDGAGRSFTDGDGRYRIGRVPAGRHTVSAVSIGYRKATREVEVGDGATVVVNFALDVSPTTLDDLVVTATGEQRRVELGHVVGRINADSIVKEAPISTLSELLTGRVAGVQVFQDQGTVGGAVRLKVRGPNSLALASDPIVIVDGVRYTTDQIPISSGLNFVDRFAAEAERTSPLNDLNPNDIESIEVVKGPSAATLYGTDAADGVILITTKRGRGGPARWNAYGRAARTSIPTFRYPDLHRGYGTRPDGTVSNNCPLVNLARGFCAQQDSVVAVPNPLNDSELTFFGTQPMWETGLNVSGGSGDVGYYFSGSYQDATGPLQMPQAAVELLEANRGERIPDEWRKPNTRENLNLRANVTAQLGTADLAVHAGYIRDETQSFPTLTFLSNGLLAGTPESPYGDAPPEEFFAGQSTERTDRFVGNGTAQWRPVPWLLTRATLGLDVGARNRSSLRRRGDASTLFFGLLSTGTVTDERARQLTSTGDLMASASARRGRLSFRTSVGAQYVRILTDVLATGGSDLPPGGSSVTEAASTSADQNFSETVTLGGYVEQMVGLNDRLFLTGALRVDGASTFGQGYDGAAYPKAGLSWLASEEPFFPGVPGLDELRLRYAFGASGLQPKPEWARPSYAASRFRSGWINDQPQTVLGLTGLGNPDLRPERVHEHEFGFDAAGLDGRAQLGLTWFRRRTVDQIVSVPVAPGFGSMFTNLGLTKQWGFEAELTAHVVDTRPFTWDVTATHSVHRTKLLDIGDVAELRRAGGPVAFPNGAIAGFVEGYSLNARFLPEVTFEDLNGDGIIARDEVQVSPPDERVYAGENEPPISQALTTLLGFFDRRVRVSALLERRAGFVQENRLKALMCSQFRCPALVDPSTPLAEQAEALRTGAAFFEPGDYTRLRELSLAVDLPRALVGRFGGRSAAVSLSGRNVALWTDFSGADVESAILARLAGIPQGRTWTVRFDVGF